MERKDAKTYRCTDCGSNATASIVDGFFTVLAGSRFGPVRNMNDRVMLRFRRVMEREGSFGSDGLTLIRDERFLYADEAARIVTGCLCDETSWVSPDGSHPTRMSADGAK